MAPGGNFPGANVVDGLPVDESSILLQFIMLIQVNAVITRMAKKFILTILQLELSTCLVAVISDTLGNLVVGYRGRFRK